MTHSTEVELVEGEQEAVQMRFSLVTGPFPALLRRPIPHVLRPPSSSASYHGLCLACPDLHTTQSFQTFGSPVLVWPLVSFPSSLLTLMPF